MKKKSPRGAKWHNVEEEGNKRIDSEASTHNTIQVEIIKDFIHFKNFAGTSSIQAQFVKYKILWSIVANRET